MSISPTSPAPTPTPPRTRWVLPIHVVAVSMVNAMWMACTFIAPVIAKKRFDASDWQMLIVAAAPTALFAFSIFWNDLFARRSLRSYLVIYWLAACAPLALIALAQNFWHFVIPFIVVSVGAGGYHPAAGELLRTIYPESSRGRMYSIVWGGSMLIGAGIGLAIGEWLTHERDAFRVMFPAIATIQAVGLALFYFLWRATGHDATRAPYTGERWSIAKALDPIVHMRTVLKRDPVFFRYEGAFMTYGVGWMIGWALVPILVTERLKLQYDQITKATYSTYVIAMVLAIVPAGWLMDRIGAIRSVGVSFALLAIYPVGLVFVADQHHLLWISAAYGVAHAGANLGWTLGPVSLAPSREKVAQYVAIHSTLVGVRGAIFQGIGVALYTLTGGFFWPFMLAAAAYVWSAVQMWQLDAFIKHRKKAASASPTQTALSDPA